MLVQIFPRLLGNRAVLSARRFFNSVWYLLMIAAATACANVFSLELPVYYFYLVCGIAASLFAEDAYPVLPVFCFAYMSVSAPNNPATNVGSSVFHQPVFLLHVAFIALSAVIFLVGRLVVELIAHPKRRRVPALSVGFLALGASYVLGGLLSGFYGGRTALFGFAEICSLGLVYFYFYYTVDWKARGAHACAVLFTCIGLCVAAEIVGMYFLPGVFGEDGVDRSKLVTGWGMYNNVGCVMAMCLPAPFYFAATRKGGWRYNLLGNLFMLAVAFTQSRASILFGGCVYLACAAAVLVKTRGKERLAHVAVYAAVVLVCAVGAAALWEKVAALFRSLLDIGFHENGRLETYKEGFSQFLSAPVFGVGFYECHGFQWGQLPPTSFLPPRYHNTYIQLLACGGGVAMLAYLVHRVQTLRLLFRRPSVEKTFIALSVVALVLTSLLDCHFFNFGPGILYSALLAFAEGGAREQP